MRNRINSCTERPRIDGSSGLLCLLDKTQSGLDSSASQQFVLLPLEPVVVHEEVLVRLFAIYAPVTM
jgi:hypothetical protein